MLQHARAMQQSSKQGSDKTTALQQVSNNAATMLQQRSKSEAAAIGSKAAAM